MSNSDWKKIDFQDFIYQYENQVVIKNAPIIMHSKKDKEHEAFKSLVTLIFIVGFTFIYVAISIMLLPIYFNSYIFYPILLVSGSIIGILLYNYIHSNVNIKLIECWFEIYKDQLNDNTTHFCFSYYPVFSGKCLPNRAKNIVYKLYQDELIKNKLDITQVEVYLKVSSSEPKNFIPLGYFFQYGEGIPFKSEEINRNSWKFFPIEKSNNDNYLATANWDHQFEWREDLELDFDKLNDYAPWILHRWDHQNLKPLTDNYKRILNWELQPIQEAPKLKPWMSKFEIQEYKDFKSYKDLQIVNEVIERIIGADVKIKKLKDLSVHLFEIKAYFRDLIV